MTPPDNINLIIKTMTGVAEMPKNEVRFMGHDMENPPQALPEDKKLMWHKLDNRTKAQLWEVFSDDNIWFAGLYYGHSPSADEAMEYFVISGGAKDFARRYSEFIKN